VIPDRFTAVGATRVSSYAHGFFLLFVVTFPRNIAPMGTADQPVPPAGFKVTFFVVDIGEPTEVPSEYTTITLPFAHDFFLILQVTRGVKFVAGRHF
jgi:hypothetical protein